MHCGYFKLYYLPLLDRERLFLEAPDPLFDLDRLFLDPTDPLFDLERLLRDPALLDLERLFLFFALGDLLFDLSIDALLPLLFRFKAGLSRLLDRDFLSAWDLLLVLLLFDSLDTERLLDRLEVFELADPDRERVVKPASLSNSNKMYEQKTS